MCVECRKEKSAKWRVENQERERNRSRNYYAENRARALEYAKANLDRINKRRRAHQQKNRDRIKETKRSWYARNADKARAQANASYKRHKKTVRTKQADFYKRNPAPFKQRARNRRALLKKAAGSHTHADIEKLYASQGGRCAICFRQLNGKYDVDHVVPLLRGGSNDPENLQLACCPCNNRKRAKDPFQFAQELGRLL